MKKWIVPAIITFELIILLVLPGSAKDAIGVVIAAPLVAALIALVAGVFSPAPFLRRFKYSLLVFLSLMVPIIALTYTDYGAAQPTMAQKTCGYCGNKFTGNGYYHIMNSCEYDSGNSGAGTHCSVKCCSEDWNQNGIDSK